MPRGEGVSAFAAVVGVVVGDDVLEGADGGVLQLGEVGLDVIVEVDFYDGVFGLVGVAAGGAVVPVPTIWADDRLVIGDFGLVDDGRAG